VSYAAGTFVKGYPGQNGNVTFTKFSMEKTPTKLLGVLPAGINAFYKKYDGVCCTATGPAI
jgi:hypothetical protein